MKTITTLVLCALSLTALAKEFMVDNASALRQAFRDAKPGDTIVMAVGQYEMGNSLATGVNGTQSRPINVRTAGTMGYAVLKAHGQVAFRIKNSFWNFNGVHFQGDEKSTEAVLFLDGPKECNDVTFKACKISGSAAYGVKSAKVRGQAANRVTFESCELFNTASTGFDLVCGDDWVVRGTYVHHYGKGRGNYYGIFMKGGGKNGSIEGNLVDGSGVSGNTIGISFGGGLTGKQWLPLLADGTLGAEHSNGIARNNIVIKTKDVAFHSNNAQNCKFYNNLAWECGADFQRQKSYPPDALLVNNLFRKTGGSLATSRHNIAANTAWFLNPSAGDFRLTEEGKKALIGKGEALPDNPTDFFGARRNGAALGPVLAGGTGVTAWRGARSGLSRQLAVGSWQSAPGAIPERGTRAFTINH